jgi:Polyphosphate kinase 2 (PPK2)
MARSLRDALRVTPATPVDLTALHPRATPPAPGGKAKTAVAAASDGAELARLQEARALPEPGMIGIFDRSHYEEVLVVRVHALAALAERKLWADYHEAYRIALERCSTPPAPWYAVPADRKWYRNWAIGRLLLETLREIDPQFPGPDLDVKALTKALGPPN